ncbi:hypothetical protein N7524_009275 [Penicillium chrysogenum]|nr:hypothetical protein N7524_009275 [Penicillium chrysogenum]
MFIVFVPILVDVLHHIGWIKTVKILIPFFLLAVSSTLLVWVSMVAFVKRKLVLWSDGDPKVEKTLLGRPLLYPARLTHARFFPEKYHYWINYFLVGVPVGLGGRVGAVVSIESDQSDQHTPVTSPFHSFVKRIFRIPLWFRIDTSWYLHRGDGHLTLAAKLEHFLKERGENPTHYPYAYLISIPQFLWWTKSPISYWYLYSPLKELSGIIMEINNSYGEKKNAFCRLTKEDSSCYEKSKSCEAFSTVSGSGPHGDQLVQFTSSAPTAKYYKGSWEKDIFASPFEKVEGGFALRFMDPLDPAPEKGGPLHSNMTLMSTSGKPKISSRLFSVAAPIDPLLVSSWELASFLLSWSFVVPVSIGRIVVEALRIRFRGNMPYLNKPDVKKGNIPRNASETERILEPFFRLYLSHLVKTCRFPLTVIYTPAKSLHLHPMIMNSPAKIFTSAPPPTLEIQPLTPQFYTNILKYADAKTGLFTELENFPQICDPVSQRLWTSDPAMLQRLTESTTNSPNAKIVQTPSTQVPAEVPVEPASLPACKTESGLRTFMDAFTDSNCSLGMRRRYRAARTYCYLTEKFAWGSYRLAAVYEFLLHTAVLGLCWRGLWWMLCDLLVSSYENVVIMAIYLAGVRAWMALNGYFYR